MKPDIGRLKGTPKKVQSITAIGGSYVLPPGIKPTASQLKEVSTFRNGLKAKEAVEKKKSAAEVKKWADTQYKKGKLSGSAWSEYVQKVA